MKHLNMILLVVLPLWAFAQSTAIDFEDALQNSSMRSEKLVETGGNTAYIDFIKLGMLDGEQMDLPVTFDDPDVAYSVVDFDGTASEITVDPTDPMNMVVATTKTAGAGASSGTTLTEDLGGSPNDPGFASPIAFTPENTIIKVRVWSPAANVPVRLKVEASGDPTISVETQTMTTVAMEWDTLDFDLKNEAVGTAALNYDADYNKLSMFFNFGTEPAADVTYYWDDVIFTGGTTPEEGVPMEPAPTPERAPEFVISMFSGAYDDVPVDTWLTGWSMSQFEDIEIQGNATKKYTNLNFAGVETLGDAAINLEAAEMTHLHVDMWTPNSTTFRIKLVDFGMDGPGGDNDSEFEIPFEGPTQEEWVSLDIALEDFMGMNQSDITQFIISSLPEGASTVYLDNVYYYNANPNSISTPQAGVLDVFPNPATAQFTVRSPKQMDQLWLYDATGRLISQWRPAAKQFELDTAELMPGMYVVVAASGQQRWVVKLVKE